MEKLKRCLAMFFSDKVEQFCPSIEEHIALKKRFFRTFSLNKNSFISFYTNDNLTDIKKTLDKNHPKSVYLLFDISDRGETFEMNFEKFEPTLLLYNINGDEDDEDLKQMKYLNPASKEIEEDLALDVILELVFKNGFSSLTEKQRKKLEDYSDDK